MTLRLNIIALAGSALVFTACCVIMFKLGPQLNSKSLVYPFMVVWGLSALVWPFFAVRVMRIALSATGDSMRRARKAQRGGYY